MTDRVVRDLDDGARLLWIPQGRTFQARRTLEVLQPYLRTLAKGKDPADRLFTESDRHFLLCHVRRICKLDGLPAIDLPRARRGTRTPTVLPTSPNASHLARFLDED